MCFAAALPRPALLCTLFGGVASAIMLEIAQSSALIFLTPRVDRAGNDAGDALVHADAPALKTTSVVT
jgi:hypothetical protein